ncbi:MAG TPA: ester cyclase [Ochrobactrum intermedium]|uniref:Ester cyclase n=1 Tax=Brucella intermedia TaxID=94625 RepID=A0A7V6P7Z9_9HYPH|nr:ester cyclase [Brucella intermedia]HHV66132.1 ester cyclase [Brucella intermedia]
MTTPQSTPQENIKVVQEAFAAFRRRDVDACVEFLTSDFIINIAGMPYQKRGARAWRTNAETMFSAFPDVEIHVEDIFGVDDKVAVRARFTGTHTGEFLGQQPTGRRIDYHSNELYRFVDGKIAEEWICSDTLTLMTQIGAMSQGKLISMWLAGFRVWFALGLGLAIGMLSMLLLRFILS